MTQRAEPVVVRVPSAAELRQARRRVLPDVVQDALRVLFCGINPGLYSAAVGHHFGRPGNQKVGCGFPVAKILALFHAGTGLLLDVIAAPLRKLMAGGLE